MSARPHRIQQRQARELARAEGIPYQAALQRLRDASGIWLGIPDLDSLMEPGGARPGRLLVIRGAAGVGCTRWMLDVLTRRARAGRHGLFISNETAATHIRAHLPASVFGVAPGASVPSGRDDELTEVLSRVHVTDSDASASTRGVEQLVAAVRQRHDVDFVCVDVLSLLAPVDADPSRSMTDNWRVVLAELREIAGRQGVTIVVSARVRPLAAASYAPARLEAGSPLRECDYALTLRRAEGRWDVALDYNRPLGTVATTSIPAPFAS